MADTADLWLPPDFPYEYASLHSSESDADDSLADLTRRFSHSSLNTTQNNIQKSALQFRSPESTLNLVGMWPVSGTKIPNATFQFPPFPPVQNDTALDFIHIAAGQVLKLKMTGDVNHRVLPVHPSQFVKPSAAGACTHRCFYTTLPQTNNIKQARVMRPQDQMLKQQSVNYGGFSESPWQPLQIKKCYGPNRPQIYSELVQKPVFLGGSHYNGVKKSRCTGTGVFLPRKYANPTEPLKKTGQVMTPPPRARVSQPLEKKLIPMAAHLQP